ncbi:MAG: hypothetical protein IPJ74_13280 [Saprospiraceae bacterium]|nr:hypothetical protein [Saprospiraceae bacterium]
MKKFTLSLSIIIISLHLYAQGTHLPLGNEAYHILDRLEIKSGVPSPFHSSLKYYTRGAATATRLCSTR